MLILSRKDGQKFFVGDDVVITVVESRKGVVRLGIDAPEDVSVDRAEIRRAKIEGLPRGGRDGVADS